MRRAPGGRLSAVLGPHTAPCVPGSFPASLLGSTAAPAALLYCGFDSIWSWDPSGEEDQLPLNLNGIQVTSTPVKNSARI